MLIILAALLLPLFLGEPKPVPQELTTSTPNKFESKIQPLPQGDAAPEIVTPDQAENNVGLVLEKINPVTPPATQPEKVKDAQLAPEPKKESVPTKTAAAPKKKEVASPVVPKAKDVPAKKAPAKQAPIAKKSDNKAIAKGWAVQAGIFSKVGNANSIANILREKGLEPKISQTTASFGDATRVWVGPFASKAEAKAVSEKLKQQTGDGGYVAEYPFKP